MDSSNTQSNRSIPVFIPISILISITYLMNVSNLILIKDNLFAIFSSGKTFLFVEAYGLLLVTMWLVLSKFNEKLGEKSKTFSGWVPALLILIGVFSINSIASEINRSIAIAEIMWWIAWITYLLTNTIFSVLPRKAEEEKIKQDYVSYAILYWAISFPLAPFLSLIKKTDLATSMIVHGLIAFGLIYGLFTLVEIRNQKKEEEKEIKKQKKKEMETKIEEFIHWLQEIIKEYAKNGNSPPKKILIILSKAQKMRDKEIKESELDLLWDEATNIANGIQEENTEVTKKEFEEKEDLFNKVQEITNSEPNNIYVTYPLLLSIANAIPKENKVKIIPFPRINAEKEAEKIKKDIFNRKKIITRFKEDYSSTRPGKEATYLLEVLKKLQEDILKRRLENWRTYVGDNWERCDFADKVLEFNNSQARYYQKILKDSTKHGPYKAIKIIKKRIHFLAKERNKILTEYVNNVNKINEFSPELIEEYRKKDQKIEEINEQKNKYNRKVEELNVNLSEIRSSLKIAASTQTESAERRSRISVAYKAFNKAIEILTELRKIEETLKKELEEENEISKATIKSKEILNKLIGLVTLIETESNLNPEAA